MCWLDRLMMRVLLLCGVYVWVGCKMFSPSHSESPSAQLSQLADDEYEFFLAYSEESETYEFLVCLQSMSVAQKDTALDYSQRCVPAYRGSMRKQGCRSYNQLKGVCQDLGLLRTYCDGLNNSQDQADSPLIGYNNFDCQYLPQITAQCDRYLPLWEPECGLWHDTKRQCLNSGETCEQFRRLDAEYFGFVMKDPQLSLSERTEFEWILNDQIRREKQGGDSLRFFGSGAALALLTKDYGSQIQSVLPRFIHRKIALGPLKFELNNLVGFLLQIQVVSVGEQGSDRLFQQLMYSPIMGCMSETLQSSPSNQKLIPLGSVGESSQALRESVMYGSLGFASNMALLRLSRGRHPVVRIGSLLAIPFMALYFAKTQENSSAAQEVSRHFDQIFGLAAERTSVSKIEDAITVLGKSLVLSSKANLSQIQHTCLPKLTAQGQVVSECQPLLTEADGILYDLAYGRVNLEEGSCDRMVRDVLGDGF